MACAGAGFWARSRRALCRTQVWFVRREPGLRQPQGRRVGGNGGDLRRVSQQCAAPCLWQAPHSGEIFGQLKGQRRAGSLPEVGVEHRPRHMGSRRLLTRRVARRWRLPSCWARPPRGPRAAPRQPRSLAPAVYPPASIWAALIP